MFLHHLLGGMENSDLRSTLLAVTAIDPAFFNLLPFCLSFCPQLHDESQSGTEEESITGNLLDAFPDDTLRHDLWLFFANQEIWCWNSIYQPIRWIYLHGCFHREYIFDDPLHPLILLIKLRMSCHPSVWKPLPKWEQIFQGKGSSKPLRLKQRPMQSILVLVFNKAQKLQVINAPMR